MLGLNQYGKNRHSSDYKTSHLTALASEGLGAICSDECGSSWMEYFPAVKSEKESFEEYTRILKHFEKHGWGFWAVSEIQGKDFIGFIGLRYDDFPAPFTPAVEVGWRLAYEAWGKGYATEGAAACLQHGFEALLLEEIISFTAALNRRSRRVMEKLGMRYAPEDDFDHPRLPEGHPLRRHVLYRLQHQAWKALTSH